MHFLKLSKIIRSLSLKCAYSSAAPKKENHYDVLQIKTNATQNEIKSAYYNLSKQFHPDINESINAKETFRKISDAYEVLGNHNSRRSYDRMMSIRKFGPSETSSFTYTRAVKQTTDDPRIRAYRDEAKSYGTGAKHSFNFDAWTEAHYGESFRRSQKLKEIHKKFRDNEYVYYSKPGYNSKKKNIFEQTNFQSILLGILTIILFICYCNMNDFDKIEDKKSEDVNKKVK